MNLNFNITVKVCSLYEFKILENIVNDKLLPSESAHYKEEKLQGDIKSLKWNGSMNGTLFALVFGLNLVNYFKNLKLIGRNLRLIEDKISLTEYLIQIYITINILFLN